MPPRRLPVAFLTVATLACSNGGLGVHHDAPRVSGEPLALAGITTAHNEIRARVGVTPLVWDDGLAATAAAWASRCVDRRGPRGVIDHNSDRSANHPAYVGENLYASTAPVSATDVVAAWAEEARHYDYDRNRCARGETCGHYTQVVWSTSRKLGCAVQDCPRLRFRNVVVCNYGPGGNSERRPY